MLTLPLIHESHVSQWRAWFEDDGERYHPRAHDRGFEEHDMVLGAEEASLGAALLHVPLAEDRLASGKLVAVGSRTLPNPLSHHVAWRRGDDRAAVISLAERLVRLADEDEHLEVGTSR